MSMRILSEGHAPKPRAQPQRRWVGNRECLDTGAVLIGLCVPVKPAQHSKHAELLQRALLDKRTEREPGPFRRVFGRIWRWC